jgi:hypothetical protein
MGLLLEFHGLGSTGWSGPAGSLLLLVPGHVHKVAKIILKRKRFSKMGI